MLSQLKTFKEFLAKYALLNNVKTFLLAVSGGKDSVMMAHLFHQAKIPFAIAHCNFNLRDQESFRDQYFVEKLAKLLDVKLHLASFNTIEYAEKNKLSIQMAARDLRYNFFEDTLQKFSYHKIAIAQHQNDAIETVFLNLVRGTGISGLHGIKIERDNIIRPLMCFTANDIQNFITENNIEYVEDSSNLSAKYARNKIRLKVIPELKKINPSLEDTFQKNINYFSELEQFLKQEISKYKLALLQKEQDYFKINIQQLKNTNNGKFIITEILLKFGFNLTSIDDLWNILHTDTQSGKTFYSQSHILILDRKDIYLKALKENTNTIVDILTETKTVNFNSYKIDIYSSTIENINFKNSNTAHLNAEKLIFPLKIRTWQEGDKFIPFGMKGMKKLSDFFISLKIPIDIKKQIPILVNGDNKIIWILNYRVDERFKITSETKKITTFEIK